MNPVALLLAALFFTTSLGTGESVRPVPAEPQQRGQVSEAGSSEVLVFTSKTACGLNRSAYRVRSHPIRTKAVLTAALNKFFRTLRHTGFPSARGNLVKRVELVDGVARIDFADFTKPLSWASTSCGMSSFMGALNNTVFQFESVRATRYLFEGSCDAFQAFMQSACVDGYGTLRRVEWQRSPAAFT